MSRGQKFKAGIPRYANREFAKTTIENPLYPYYQGFKYGEEFPLISHDNLIATQGNNGIRSLDIYLDLLTDSYVFYCFDEQVSEIINRSWEIIPNGADQEIVDFVTEQLKSLGTLDRNSIFIDGQEVQAANIDSGFNDLVRGMSIGWLVGRSFHEIMWGRSNLGKIIAREIKYRDPRRFIYFSDGEGNMYPKLARTAYAYDGDYLPPRKFLQYNFRAIPTEDPMGFGYGRMLYFPVSWKRETLTYWLTNIDTSSEPTRIGTYEETATQEQIDEFFNIVTSISRQSSAIFPEGFTLDFKEHNIRGAVDLLKELVDYCDKNIAMILLGEASTGEQIPGSRSREEVNNSIRVMKAAALAESIAENLNSTLIRWLVALNFNTEKFPKIRFNFPETKQFADGLTTPEDLLINKLLLLRDLGYEADMDWMEEQFRIPKKAASPGQTPDGELIEPPALPSINF